MYAVQYEVAETKTIMLSGKNDIDKAFNHIEEHIKNIEPNYVRESISISPISDKTNSRSY